MRSLLERFKEKFIPEPNTGCWLWTGYIGVDGYGKIALGRQSEGTEHAQRVAWRLYRGEIPDGLVVCHHCDVRACVNPDHLFLGTQADNLEDMRNKHRGSKPPRRVGEQHHKAKLTLAEVEEIRRRGATGENPTQLATEYSVSRWTINGILQKKTWVS